MASAVSVDELKRLLSSKPWLIPVLASLQSDSVRQSEVASALGTNTDYVKHCLTELARAGVAEKAGEGAYRVNLSLVRDALSAVRVKRVGCCWLAELPGYYAMVRVRRRYARVIRVEKEVVKKALDFLADAGEATASQVGRTLGVHPRVASRALRVLAALGLAEPLPGRPRRYRHSTQFSPGTP